jgi:hypothetical protein
VTPAAPIEAAKPTATVDEAKALAQAVHDKNRRYRS